MNLIKKPKKVKNSDRINFPFVKKYKTFYFKEAFHNFIHDDDYKKFITNKNIYEYAYFSDKNNIDYYLFLQYIAYKQCMELKEYANKKGVKIIGDMPIYPDYNSAHVKFDPQYFQLNDSGKMDFVSGAPGDYFNKNGQKWGHPLYNFKNIAKDNYIFLIDRYTYYTKLFDITRIDHFKGYESFYKIPYNKEPIDGSYEEGPNSKFFDKLFKKIDANQLIVEDLGDVTDKLIKLRDKYNFKGMKILQYTLNLSKGKDEYPKNNNIVFYTGNHDNNTIIGYYNNLSNFEQKKLIHFFKENNCYDKKIYRSFIKYCLKSDAAMVIISVQDIIRLDEKSRIIIPGVVADKNWSWKLKNFNKLNIDIKYLKR